MREGRSLWRKAIVLCVFAAAVIIGTGHLTEARAYETAYYPAPQVYLTQLAYESYSHGSCNAIDMAPGGDVFAPFTGKILQKDARWGYVLFQSTDKVYYADGTLDYMTVGFMHDSDISNLYVGQTISQGTKFYQAGGMGNGVPNAYGPHVDLSVFKGKVNSVTQYGRGNYFAYKAFYVYTAKTKIVYPGVVESGNRVNNGAPSNYSGLWKTISQPVSSSPDITISGANAPGTISVGNVFSITGTVNSGMPLTNVTAGVYDYSGAMKTGKSAAPNAASYNIKNLDNYVYFNHLPAGVYTYKVTASNASKSATLVSKVFIVLGNARTINDGIYNFHSKGGDEYGLTVEYTSREPAKLIHIWKDNPDNNFMKWKIQYAGGGYYTIINSASEMALDVGNSSSQSGGKVQQYTPSDNNTAQLWQILQVGSHYCLVPKCATSCCLDIYNGDMTNGNPVWTYTANMSNAQLWKFTATSVSGTPDNNNRADGENKKTDTGTQQTPSAGTQKPPAGAVQTPAGNGASDNQGSTVSRPPAAGGGGADSVPQSGAGTGKTVKTSNKKTKQPMKVSPGTKKFSAAKLKKKGRTFKISVKKAKGKVTYKSSNKKYVKVTSKGKVTVKKKTPKGTYKITVRARGNKKYKSGSRTIKIKVK